MEASGEGVAFAEAREHAVEADDRQQTGQERQHRQCFRLDHRWRCVDPEAGDGRGDFSERDVDRIPRRMRAMRGHVEVAHAEGEVDRVDVLERGGEERHVRQREDQRERRQHSLKGHETGRKRSASFRLPNR